MRVGGLGPEELQTWLEWAGQRLVALPANGIRPARPRVFWPDYAQDRFQVLEFRGKIGLSMRAAAPAASEIPFVDEILLLPNACAKIPSRRVLHARALINPLNGRNLYNWTVLAERLHMDRRSVKRLHERALEEAARLAEPPRVCRIRAFFAE